MSETIIQRLDRFVVSLLDESEHDTSSSTEDSPGSQRASIMDRVHVLKAAVSYLSVRNKLTEGDGGEAAEEPEIVRFENRLKPRGARRS